MVYLKFIMTRSILLFLLALVKCKLFLSFKFLKPNYRSIGFSTFVKIFHCSVERFTASIVLVEKRSCVLLSMYIFHVLLTPSTIDKPQDHLFLSTSTTALFASPSPILTWPFHMLTRHNANIHATTSTVSLS